jgi:hypothetical protein
MFEIKLDGVDALVKKFETLDRQIEELHKKFPEQLFEWQRVDMRRQYPNMQIEETAQTVHATTEVWPHSRLELEPGNPRKRVVVATKPKRYAPKGTGQPRAPSVRPILREELERKLWERLDATGREAIKWP